MSAGAMTDAEFLCPKCGKSDGFYANVTIYDAWQNAEVEVGEDGSPRLEAHGEIEDAYDGDVTGYACSCGHHFTNPANELRRVWREWEPGQVVVAPDGLKAVVERVEGEDVYVIGWHERFRYSDLRELDGAPLVPLQEAA